MVKGVSKTDVEIVQCVAPQKLVACLVYKYTYVLANSCCALCSNHFVQILYLFVQPLFLGIFGNLRSVPICTAKVEFILF